MDVDELDDAGPETADGRRTYPAERRGPTTKMAGSFAAISSSTAIGFSV